jgi:hypothetical protein
MKRTLHPLIAAAVLLAGTETSAAEQLIEMKSDPDGRNYIVARQGTKEDPVLVTKRLGPNNYVFYMKRAFDCRNRTVRNLGWGATPEEMEKQAPEPESSPIEPGSIPDHYVRHACPAPHPAPRP